MFATLLTLLATPASPLTLADQNWKLSLNVNGVFKTPVGDLKDPSLTGSIELRRLKDVKKESLYRIHLALPKKQNPLTEFIQTTMKDEMVTKETPVAIFKDDQNVNFINSYFFDPQTLNVKSMEINTYSPPEEVLGPIAMAFALGQRAINNPELKKEYLLRDDSPRKFYVTFRPNLNANTESVPGDVAFKFDLKLDEPNGKYPQFFTGAIRLNTKTGLIQYINANSVPENQPAPPEDADLGTNKSYAIRIEPLPPKKTS